MLPSPSYMAILPDVLQPGHGFFPALPPAEQTLHHQKRFLEAYAACGMVSKAAETAEISRMQVWRWMQDEDFEAACSAVEAIYTQQLRDISYRRAADDSRPATDLYFELKRRDPAYKDNFQVNVNVGVVAGGDWQEAARALAKIGEPDQPGRG